MNITSCIKDSIPFLFVMTRIGKLGHHIISCIFMRNGHGAEQKTDQTFQQTKKFDQEDWWQQIKQSKGFHNKEPKDLITEQARDEEASRLQHLYATSSGSEIAIPKSMYGNFLGSVYGLSCNFGLWMPGVALLASYLTEKKGITGLYVCDSLEGLQAQIREVHRSDSDTRRAFVIGTFQSGFKQQFDFGFDPNFPQHKVTVCVEKKGGQLTIALLDAEPIPGNAEISPNALAHSDIWDGYDQYDQFNNQELVFRAILKTCREEKCNARLLHSQVVRQTAYGCTIFALQDALAYLRDVHFFDKIVCSKQHSIKIDDQYTIETIDRLPPECMIGTQSSRQIQKFRQEGGVFNHPLIGKKKKTLQQYFDTYQLDVPNDRGNVKKQNHYITKKNFKYLNLVVQCLNQMNLEAIQTIVNKTLVSDKKGPVALSRKPRFVHECAPLDRRDEKLESHRHIEPRRRLII